MPPTKVEKTKMKIAPEKIENTPQKKGDANKSAPTEELSKRIEQLLIENAALKFSFNIERILVELKRENIDKTDFIVQGTISTLVEILEQHKKENSKNAERKRSVEELKHREKRQIEVDGGVLMQKIEDLQTSVDNLTRLVMKKDEEIQRLRKLETVKHELTEQIKILQTETDEQRDKVALLADKQKRDLEMQRLQWENKELKQLVDKNKNQNETLKKLEEEKYYLKQQMTILQTKNDELKYRLSDIDWEKMTNSNRNIVDLSDAFRPTKLCEEYTQIYDNLWVDAFEEKEIGGEKEEHILQMLLETLVGSYKFCEKISREFTDQLTNSSLALPNSKLKNMDIPIVYKKQLQEMKKSFGVLLRNDVKEAYWKQNVRVGGLKTKNYVDVCVDLCWLMVIQEPPVIIETPASKDSAFDSDTYRTYTKTGKKVDFVVWPALRLHEGGPLLTKGIAQGKN